MSNYNLYRGVDERDGTPTYFVVEDGTGRCAAFVDVRTLDGEILEGDKFLTVVGEAIKDKEVMEMMFEEASTDMSIFSDVKLVQHFSGELQ